MDKTIGSESCLRRDPACRVESAGTRRLGAVSFPDRAAKLDSGWIALDASSHSRTANSRSLPAVVHPKARTSSHQLPNRKRSIHGKPHACPIHRCFPALGSPVASGHGTEA